VGIQRHGRAACEAARGQCAFLNRQISVNEKNEYLTGAPGARPVGSGAAAVAASVGGCGLR